MACRRSGSKLGFVLIFLLDLLGTAVSNMEPIYWNSLNKRYVGSKVVQPMGLLCSRL